MTKHLHILRYVASTVSEENMAYTAQFSHLVDWADVGGTHKGQRLTCPAVADPASFPANIPMRRHVADHKW